MRVLAIDPGPEQSAAVIYNAKGVWPLPDHRVPLARICDNRQLTDELGDWAQAVNLVVIEEIASYGMPVGRDVFETCIWIGRMMERLWVADPNTTVRLMPRREVKLHLCGDLRAKDSNIRRALLDLERWPRSEKGAEPVIGVKSAPGPLYGFKSHLWSALALAVTGADKARRVEVE